MNTLYYKEIKTRHPSFYQCFHNTASNFSPHNASTLLMRPYTKSTTVSSSSPALLNKWKTYFSFLTDRRWYFRAFSSSSTSDEISSSSPFLLNRRKTYFSFLIDRRWYFRAKNSYPTSDEISPSSLSPPC